VPQLGAEYDDASVCDVDDSECEYDEAAVCNVNYIVWRLKRSIAWIFPFDPVTLLSKF
jgi:hypothetical protein